MVSPTLLLCFWAFIASATAQQWRVRYYSGYHSFENGRHHERFASLVQPIQTRHITRVVKLIPHWSNGRFRARVLQPEMAGLIANVYAAENLEQADRVLSEMVEMVAQHVQQMN